LANLFATTNCNSDVVVVAQLAGDATAEIGANNQALTHSLCGLARKRPRPTQSPGSGAVTFLAHAPGLRQGVLTRVGLATRRISLTPLLKELTLLT
jgi:hypothetical protein